jgi:type II secretory ATPase GspE/PulE/Tfp pilus assembly ATPase PilB-like protein
MNQKAQKDTTARDWRRSPERRPPANEDIMGRLATLLKERRHVTPEQIDDALERVKWTDEPLHDILIDDGLVSEQVLLNLVSELSGIPFRRLVHTQIDASSINLVNAKIAVRYRVMPLDIRNQRLVLASDKILDSTTEDQLRLILGYPLDWILCTSHDLDECIKHYYGVGIGEFLSIKSGQPPAEAGTSQSPDTDVTHVADFVTCIIQDAVRANATDIHFEPTTEGLKLRYRIDGVLSRVTLPHGIQQYARAVVSASKVMAQLNIAEKRLPQDGRFTMNVDNEEIDMRVSVLPSSHGEGVNIRLLKRTGTFFTIRELGLQDNQRLLLDELLSVPHGVVLFTGPTGSGKTTSLYASLERLNTPERKIITIEDPVEYDIAEIMQLQVKPDIGFTFASGLRSVLRHDPDIVLIGEIRDYETADIAISSALTGHLVFSTLHTNDSPSAITRLTDIGVEPYLIASGLSGVVAQRLVRKICSSCREPAQIDASIMEKVQERVPDLSVSHTFYKGEGCPDCRFTGYRGRKALFEILPMSDELRKMVVESASSSAIMELALSQGLKTLRTSGMACAAEGITTVEEVLRVT